MSRFPISFFSTCGQSSPLFSLPILLFLLISGSLNLYFYFITLRPSFNAHHVDVGSIFPCHHVSCPPPPHTSLLTPPRFSYGESHCRSVGCIVDGCPPGLELTEADIQPQMTRRRPGQSALTTPRDEKDRVEIQSGTEFGITLGTPIAMVVRNEDQRPKDYGNSTMDLYPRPSHADFTYLEKYGVKASSGGGRSSARETIGTLCVTINIGNEYSC